MKKEGTENTAGHGVLIIEDMESNHGQTGQKFDQVNIVIAGDVRARG